jgi:hypothetical protein
MFRPLSQLEKGTPFVIESDYFVDVACLSMSIEVEEGRLVYIE